MLGSKRMGQVLANIERRCKYAVKATSSIRVKGGQAEAIMADALCDAKVPIENATDKHTPGADIFPTFRSRVIDGISAKSGKKKKHRGVENTLALSGYRLGRFHKDLDATVTWIQENKPSAFLCLANPTPAGKKAKVFADFYLYSVFLFEAHLLDYGTPEMWTASENGKRYFLETPYMKAEIRHSMSSQLWTYIDINALGIQPMHSFAVPNKKSLTLRRPT